MPKKNRTSCIPISYIIIGRIAFKQRSNNNFSNKNKTNNETQIKHGKWSVKKVGLWKK